MHTVIIATSVLLKLASNRIQPKLKLISKVAALEDQDAPIARDIVAMMYKKFCFNLDLSRYNIMFGYCHILQGINCGGGAA